MKPGARSGPRLRGSTGGSTAWIYLSVGADLPRAAVLPFARTAPARALERLRTTHTSFAAAWPADLSVVGTGRGFVNARRRGSRCQVPDGSGGQTSIDQRHNNPYVTRAGMVHVQCRGWSREPVARRSPDRAIGTARVPRTLRMGFSLALARMRTIASSLGGFWRGITWRARLGWPLRPSLLHVPGTPASSWDYCASRPACGGTSRKIPGSRTCSRQ